MLRVFCKNTGTFQEFPEGTMLLEMIDSFEFERPYEIIAAKVNNVAQGLKFRVYNNRDVEFLDYPRTAEGMSIAVHSASCSIRPRRTFSRIARW